MKINKSSWSYKLLKKMNADVYRDLLYGDKPVTSCQYRWAVFTNLLLSIFWLVTIICAGFFGIFILIFTVSCNIQYIGNLFGAEIHWIQGTNTGIVTLSTWCLIGFFVHLVMEEKRKVEKYIKSLFEDKVPPKKGAVAQWYDEVKNKYCSIVELEEDRTL